MDSKQAQSAKKSLYEFGYFILSNANGEEYFLHSLTWARKQKFIPEGFLNPYLLIFESGILQGLIERPQEVLFDLWEFAEEGTLFYLKRKALDWLKPIEHDEEVLACLPIKNTSWTPLLEAHGGYLLMDKRLGLGWKQVDNVVTLPFPEYLSIRKRISLQPDGEIKVF